MAKNVYVVTGAARGIGCEFIHQISQRQDTIVYAGVRTVSNATSLSVSENIRVLECDVTSDSSVLKFVEKISQNEDKVDVLINNAGIDLLLPIHETSTEDFQKVLETNLIGIHRMIKSMLSLLLNSESKKIVNIGSRYASNTMNEWKERGAYSICSAGLNMLTTTYKNSFKDKGLILVSVHPGRVQL
jgi:NAD(P)-dependent dehydrogenase (short-subunit alcohol dehydrogenase family)